MARLLAATEYCITCKHYGYCAVYWGADCKRQGGKQIPRMKARPAQEMDSIQNAPPLIYLEDVPATDVPRKGTVSQTTINNYEKYKQSSESVIKKLNRLQDAIKTKIVNW